MIPAPLIQFVGNTLAQEEMNFALISAKYSITNPVTIQSLEAMVFPKTF